MSNTVAPLDRIRLEEFEAHITNNGDPADHTSLLAKDPVWAWNDSDPEYLNADTARLWKLWMKAWTSGLIWGRETSHVTW